MVKDKKILFWIKAFFFIALLLSTTINNVFACSPGGPDAWFTTKLSIDKSTLPEGVKFHQPNDLFDPQSSEENYTLTNENAEPFYILIPGSWNIHDGYPKPEVEFNLPENFLPESKITNTQVYYWWSSSGSSTDAREWIPIDRNSSKHDDIFKKSVSIDDMYTLDGKSKQVYEDNRPAVVDVPTPQSLKIFGFYKGKLVEIKGTLTYFINTNYKPQMYAGGIEVCTKFNQGQMASQVVAMIISVVVPFLLLTVALFMFYLIIRKVNKKTNAT